MIAREKALECEKARRYEERRGTFRIVYEARRVLEWQMRNWSGLISGFIVNGVVGEWVELHRLKIR